jgi:hypothetical protein
VSEHDWVRFKSLTAFESMQQLALFHKGWTAARDAGEADELCSRRWPGVHSARRHPEQRPESLHVG